MGLFNKGASKNDVKIAKMELEKEKLIQKNQKKNSKEQKRLEIIERAKKLSAYTKENFDRFCTVINNLENETNTLLFEISRCNTSGLSFKEKGEFKKKKQNAKDNIMYLYLVKDYLTFVEKALNDLPMKDNQYIYIIKFIPFFDGVNVFEETDDDDDSLLGEFKEIGKELLSVFVSTGSSSSFHFEDFYSNYYNEIEELKAPDLSYLIESIRGKAKVVETVNTSNQAVSSETMIECQNCGCKLNSTSKFCPECGTKVEPPKKKFCSECGAQLDGNVKFCPECGTKVN